MQNADNSNNLRMWRESGEHLLLVQPFMDSVIVRGEGCFLIDADGQRILDLAAGQFCSILGHNNTEFTARLQEQASKIVHLADQYVSPEVMKAAARLADIAPGNLNKVILLSTGSEANECAMRIAKAVTSRTGMLGFTRGYYGISLATHNLSSISDHPGKHDFQPSPANQFKLLTPSCNHCPLRLTHPACNTACLDVSLEYVSSQLDNIAAVIVEPIVSAGGMIFPPTDYLQKLRDVTRNLGILLIVDEAQTGFGRCGQWFDVQNHAIEPDILVLSKTAGNGYPAAAVIVTDAVAKKLESRRFMHLSSHQNDPLAAAVVLAVIDTVERQGLIQQSRAMGEYFMEGLGLLKEKHSLITDVRGRGLMIGIELDPSGPNRDALALKAAMLCERKGVHLTFSYFEPVLRIIPPLIISEAEIDMALSVLNDVLTTLETGEVDVLPLIPQNIVSGDFVRDMVKSSPGAMLRKMWTTSPRQWVDKLKSMRAH
jgi:2,2-dialkylglycine decarboxylase (pyruvate)